MHVLKTDLRHLGGNCSAFSNKYLNYFDLCLRVFKLLMHPDAPCVILLHKVCVTLVNSSGYLAMLK